ncbi:CaiB/BaiF CoA-transferase family protein [Cumulibacter soli]|uniref:CaiB/BaiF CoA-transferase family protein n=1 Tax=Cumulibacter soli TaxID=2546344 RepID=UPI0010674268|nr:CoA transferase [Cumulibacter soli]
MSETSDVDANGAPLAGLRVLELSDSAGALGGRFLAALGATVLRVDRPNSDRGAEPGTCREARDLTLHVGKQSVEIDTSSADGRRELTALITGSDLVICSPGRPIMDQLGISIEAFAEEHPDVALVLLDPFPPDSPFNGETATDLLLSAAGGLAWLCGGAEGRPEQPKELLSQSYAAISASLAGLLGVNARALQGRAGWFEVTAQEAVAFASAQTGDVNHLTWHDRIPSRPSWAENPRGGVFQCADGRWVSVVFFGARYKQVIAWFQQERLGETYHDPAWLDYEYYFERIQQLAETMAELCTRYTADEVVQSGQSRLIMVTPVLGATDLLSDPQLLARNMFSAVPDSPSPVVVPRAPLVFSHATLPRPTAPPRPGAHDPAMLAEWLQESARRQGGRSAVSQTGRLPLEGLRVADFTWMLAGPIAARFLADMGADVVRLESSTRQDLAREIGNHPPGLQTIDTNSHQNLAGGNKRSLAVNMREAEGVEIARKAIGWADVVIENFRGGAMAKWGLDPESLLADRPELIVLSIPAVGSDGPRSGFGAIGSGVAAYGGINMLTGFPENPPRGVGVMIADFFTPLFAVQGVLAALYERQRSGRGQHIDAAMLESTLWMTGTTLADAQFEGQDPKRRGNRDLSMAPHGIFRCQGDDEWLALSIRSDGEWRDLCRVLSIPLECAERFALASTRLAHQDEVERVVEDATKKCVRWELSEQLQAAGVPAVPLENVADHLYHDAGMHRRWTEHTHPFGYPLMSQNQFIRPGGSVVPSRRYPNLGEHTAEVLGELGFSEDAVNDLFSRGILK